MDITLSTWEPLIIAVVPIIIGWVKRLNLAPWILPILAAVFGGALQIVQALIASAPLQPIVGAVLGLLAVGLRELIKHWPGMPNGIRAS